MPVLSFPCRPKLLANHIGASSRSHPDLVRAASIYINAGAWPKCCVRWGLVLRIGNGQLAIDNKMRCEAAVLVWWIVGISVLDCPSMSLSVKPATNISLTDRQSR